MFWIRFCFNNCSVIFTVTLWYVLHHTHSKFSHIQNSAYSGIWRHIQAYSALLRHIHEYWDIIKAYPGLFRHIQHPVKPSHIYNLTIFESLAYLEPKAYSKPYKTLNRHIQNLTIVRTVYSSIIQQYSDIFRTSCNACLWGNLAYSESWNIQNSSIIASRRIFRALSYLRKFTNIRNSGIFKTRHIFRTPSKIFSFLQK